MAALKSGLPQNPAAKLCWSSALKDKEKEEKELREMIRGDLAHLAEVENRPLQTTLWGTPPPWLRLWLRSTRSTSSQQ